MIERKHPSKIFAYWTIIENALKIYEQAWSQVQPWILIGKLVTV